MFRKARNKAQKEKGYDTTDSRFNCEEAKLAYPKFPKFDVRDEDETSASAVISFVPVILDAVKFLNQSMKWMKNEQQKNDGALKAKRFLFL